MSMNDDEARKVIATTLKNTRLAPAAWCDDLTTHIMKNLKEAGFGFSHNTDDFPNAEDN